jgi:membrane-bound ClpP family serine protease
MILGLVFVLILLVSAASPLATEGQANLTTEQFSVNDLVLAADNPPQDTRYIPVLSINGAIGPAVSDYITRNNLSINTQANVLAISITLDTPSGSNSILSITTAQKMGEKDE